MATEQISNNEQDINIGRQIDDLLEMDDGSLLAEMARIRTNLVSLFGNDEIVALIRKTVDEAENVEFFTPRSRKNIDKHRPIINLHVIPENIREKYASSDIGQSMNEEDWKYFPFGKNNKVEDPQQIKYYRLLSGIIHREVCSVVAETMRLALNKHWQKARDKMANDNMEIVSMIIFQIFSVLVNPDIAQARQRGRRRCTLRMMI